MADIEYKTPQDVADEKARKKAGAAYDKAMPEPDTTTGNFEGYRKQKQGEIAERKAAREAAASAKSEKISKAQYDKSVKDYERDLALDPPDKNPIGYKMRKFGDAVGDKVRGVGEFFNINNMTSMDDKAKMQARKDVKGYANGGSVSSASKRADGIATRGKTRGTIIT
jgi:hypothetical protein